MVQMPPHFSGPFSAHRQHHVYYSLPISRIIWQCVFQSPQYHPATNPQYRPESSRPLSFIRPRDRQVIATQDHRSVSLTPLVPATLPHRCHLQV
jgi:hypothetical protein